MASFHRAAWLCSVALVAACSVHSGPGVRLEVVLDGSEVRIEEVSRFPGTARPLPEGRPIDIQVRDADSGALLTSGTLSDRRFVVYELDHPLAEGESSHVRVDRARYLVDSPAPASGRGTLHLAFDVDGTRVERSVSFTAPPADAARAPLTSEVGAHRAAVSDCDAPNPTQCCPSTYSITSADIGCGDMRHLGGNPDPRGALLFVLIPAGGFTDAQQFVDVATAVVAQSMSVDWVRDHRDQLSFYALYDDAVVERHNEEAGTIDCALSTISNYGDPRRTSIFNRVSGAPMHELPRGHDVAVDVWVGLVNNDPSAGQRCNGWATDPLEIGPGAIGDPGEDVHIILGTHVGCGSHIETDVVVSCPPGVRLAHELGHALAGLADEYGNVCGTYPDRTYPNYRVVAEDPPWACYIGRDPQLTCPDHSPPLNSFVRDSRNDGCHRPCSDSIMMGFFGTTEQFDPYSTDLMTAALRRELGDSEFAFPTCETSAECTPAECEDCGRDGCGSDCACTCGASGACESSISSIVCGGTVHCARTMHLADDSCPSTARSMSRIVRGTCATDGTWVATNCRTYGAADDQELVRCLTAP